MLVRLDSSKSGFETLGNKGKFLLLMRQNGLNVPNGFVLDSDTYDETVKGETNAAIKEALSGLSKDNVKETTEKIRAIFETVELPDGIVSELDDVLQPDKLYAVRSSGTKEDLDEFSFAGQYPRHAFQASVTFMPSSNMNSSMPAPK